MRKIAFEKEIRFELISELTTYIGYGGLIHHFKNYMLRGDERYVDSFNRQYQSAADILDRYSKLIVQVMLNPRSYLRKRIL